MGTPEHETPQQRAHRIDRLLEPLRSQPQRSALLFDVDGALAPIVATPEEASVPEQTRLVLSTLAREYALVACVSGRQVRDARRVVGIGSIAYSGNHGSEYLAPSADQVEVDSRVASSAQRVRDFAESRLTPRLRQAGIRFEDKNTICAFHWRSAPDQVGARALLEQVAADARQRGLITHWGRKVLEIRPDVEITKGNAIDVALAHADIDNALYAGDDKTDLDAFHKLRDLRTRGDLTIAVCIGVISEEGPPEIASEADATVEGPPGLAEMLRLLRLAETD